MGVRGFLKFLPARAHRLFLPNRGLANRQTVVVAREIFSLQIFSRVIGARDKREPKQNEKDDEDQTAFGETTEPALPRWRFDPGGAAVHRLRSLSIFACASISLS